MWQPRRDALSASATVLSNLAWVDILFDSLPDVTMQGDTDRLLCHWRYRWATMAM